MYRFRDVRGTATLTSDQIGLCYREQGQLADLLLKSRLDPFNAEAERFSSIGACLCPGFEKRAVIQALARCTSHPLP